MDEDTEVYVMDETLAKTPAKSIKPGMMVFTHENRFKAVTSVSYRVTGMVELETSKGKIRVSDEHMMLVYDVVDNEYGWEKAGLMDTSRHKLVENTILSEGLFELITEVSEDDQLGIRIATTERAFSFSRTHGVPVIIPGTMEFSTTPAEQVIVGSVLVLRQ